MSGGIDGLLSITVPSQMGSPGHFPPVVRMCVLTVCDDPYSYFSISPSFSLIFLAYPNIMKH
jgi:hypothetical protein